VSGRRRRASTRTVVAVLDDDPTGTQEAAETPVLMNWSARDLERLPGRPFHLLTNTRAHSAEDAYAITRDAVTHVLERFPAAEILLRGDSTLRAHVKEEYDAVRDARWPGTAAPCLLLVPALPGAGRVTIGGVHWLARDGARRPIAETEYARDGSFRYRSSRLLDWAEERSGGYFDPSGGIEVPLAVLRRHGGTAVCRALTACAGRERPAVCVPDAEAHTDLRAIADGLRAARAAGVPVIARCAPSFAAVLCRTRATRLVPVPRAESVLVVCGSHVPQTTRQLASLEDRRRGALVEVELDDLIEARVDETADSVEHIRRLLSGRRLAVVATPRSRSAAADDPVRATTITDGLARLTAMVAGEAALIVFKGGITSAVGIRDGLGARSAIVEGPVRPGIGLWRLDGGRRVLVFPGNVGDDHALADLVEEILA
jgi:uncharacterized protein YgbK (DUF1537 family)